jgi:hypothetical protein
MVRRSGRPPSKAVISRQEMAGLHPNDEKEVIRGTVAKILRENPLGVTAPRVAEEIGIAPTTARGHLDYLVAIGDAYRHELGTRTVMYLPNGKLAHALQEDPLSMGDKYYTFKMLSNAFGDVILIQERIKDPWGVWKTVGGVAVQTKALRDFASKLQRTADELGIREIGDVTP